MLSQTADWGRQEAMSKNSSGRRKNKRHGMTTLASAHETRRKDGALVRYGLGVGTHIQKGGLTAVTVTGLAQPASDSAGQIFIGVAYEEGGGIGGSAAKSVRVLKTGVFTYAKAGASLSDIGRTAFVVDDGTVSTSATTNSIACGVVVGAPDALSVQVRIDGKVN